MRISPLYVMSHQFESYKLKVSMLCNQKMEADDKADLGQVLSQYPHADRRAFMQHLHTLYQRTRCVHNISSELESSTYYQHVKEQKYELDCLMLQHNSSENCYHYMFFIVTSK